MARILPNVAGGSVWSCKCDCGKSTTALGMWLRGGNKSSCGCLRHFVGGRLTHRMSKSPTYVTWSAMMTRCYNKNIREFHRYGGRGISVCKRWHKFENFFADMGTRPSGLTIERKNNDGNYTPRNCVWATRKEQGANRSRVRKINLGGKVLTLRDACIVLGKNYSTVLMRIHGGMPIKDALK